jgi:hypothetical protein
MSPFTLEMHRWLSLPFRWGESDCCILLADWVRRARGLDYDPAERVRWTYDSLATCHKEVGWLRDPVGAVGAILEGVVGLRRTDTPRRGDVGVVLAIVDGREMAVGAAFTGERWISKAQNGITVHRPRRVLAAWDVGYADSAPSASPAADPGAR